MALGYETLPGDVDHLVADDHAVVKRMFEHWQAGRGNRRALADQIGFNIALHADAEERTFYPALREIGRDADAEKLISEHQQVKELLVVVEDGSPGEAAFEQAMGKIIAAILKHATEEETTFLPALRQAVGAAKMAELGEKFIAAKRTAPTFTHPAGPSSKTGHVLLDAGVKMLDGLQEKASGRIKRLGTDASGLLDPQAQRIADAHANLEPKPFEILTPDLARKQPTPVDAIHKILEADGKSTDPEPVGSVEDRMIPGPGGQLKVRIYQPQGEGPFPMLMWIHGGGWVLFDIDTYDASCRGLCNKAQVIVVSPDYRRAPEHVFPASHDDVLAAWRWMADNAAALGGDPSRLAIGGESVGGNMSAATCLQLKTQGERLPLAQVLVYPLTTGEQFGESMEDAADARPVNRPLISWMAMHAFKGIPEGAKDPRVHLLGVSKTELAGLPPALVIVDERDPLRSQGEEFARHLEAAGVETRVRRYDGVFHEFFGAAAVLDKAEEAQREAANLLREVFGEEEDRDIRRPSEPAELPR
ncbi:MAG TPA: alpha/beta hydrolase fold domain-containing protein [Myxococcales bacterium]|nr:alpha/beta hydrolase fold domain-containing protein [Myxococcales bacterium]